MRFVILLDVPSQLNFVLLGNRKVEDKSNLSNLSKSLAILSDNKDVRKVDFCGPEAVEVRRVVGSSTFFFFALSATADSFEQNSSSVF